MNTFGSNDLPGPTTKSIKASICEERLTLYSDSPTLKFVIFKTEISVLRKPQITHQQYYFSSNTVYREIPDKPPQLPIFLHRKVMIG
jgi:hypothetical protein